MHKFVYICMSFMTVFKDAKDSILSCRIYNLLSAEIPEQTISVGPAEIGVISNSSLVCNSVLGEDAVGFDIGVPTELVKPISGNPVSNQSFEFMVSDSVFLHSTCSQHSNLLINLLLCCYVLDV